MVHWHVWYNFDIALTNCWCGCYNGSVTSGGLAGAIVTIWFCYCYSGFLAGASVRIWFCYCYCYCYSGVLAGAIVTKWFCYCYSGVLAVTVTVTVIVVFWLVRVVPNAESQHKASPTVLRSHIKRSMVMVIRVMVIIMMMIRVMVIITMMIMMMIMMIVMMIEIIGNKFGYSVLGNARKHFYKVPLIAARFSTL